MTGESSVDVAASGTLHLALLGSFSVRVGNRATPGSWRLRKSKTLVKLLALADGHRAHRDVLSGVLWPGLDPAAAANNLHQALHAARRALASDRPPSADTLCLRDDIVILWPDGDLIVDADVFAAAARRALRSGSVEDYEGALKLYAGELLPEDRYADWAAPHRERLACIGCSHRAARRLRCTVLNMFESASGGPLRFWSSYTLGMLGRLPASSAAAARAHASHLHDYARTYRRKVIVVDQQLELWFLGAPRADLVPLIFGERYCAILYRGVLVDPGSILMRRSLQRHFDGTAAGSVTAVTATHGHEEHVGNLEWAANRTAAPLYLPDALASRLRSPQPLPAARSFAFGRPHALTCLVSDTAGGIPAGDGRLDVIPAPGHSAEHVVLFDPSERVLLVGDAFIGAYFSAANAETDGHAWLDTLRRLLHLDFDLMVEGHGRVHTLRSDVPAIPGVVVREDPRLIVAAKLRFLTLLAQRARAARDRGLSINRAVAEAFPWQQRPSWDRLCADELARVTSCGEFSRHKLVKSFLDSATAGPR